jgi:hypothetical protein
VVVVGARRDREAIAGMQGQAETACGRWMREHQAAAGTVQMVCLVLGTGSLAARYEPAGPVLRAALQRDGRVIFAEDGEGLVPLTARERQVAAMAALAGYRSVPLRRTDQNAGSCWKSWVLLYS